MRVAALYDIHANLPALEAVLQEVQQAEVDLLLIGGDVVPGPMPRETISCLMDLDMPVRFIHGNGDREVLAQMRGIESAAIPEPFRAVMRWTAQQLQVEYEQILASWPSTRRLQVQSVGDVLFCHATPRNDTEIFTRLTTESRLIPVFAGLNVALVVCGHTHMQFDRTIGTIRVVNAGSVGMPFQERGAYWLLLGPAVEFRRTLFDFETAADRIRSTQYPQAEDFAARNVLQPPSEAETLEAFRRIELR